MNDESVPRIPTPVFFQHFEVERGVCGVPTEPPVDGVAGVADGYFPDHEVDESVDGGHPDQRQHGVSWGIPGEEEQAEQHSDDNDGQTQRAVEILLNVKIIVAAGRAGVDHIPGSDHGCRAQIQLAATGGALQSVEGEGSGLDFRFTARTLEMYDFAHESHS